MASSSSFIASIDSLIKRSSGSTYQLGCWLRSLKVYVVCLSKFGDSALWGSSSSQSPFFSRIQDAILKRVQPDAEDEDEDKNFAAFRQEIHSLVKETDELYPILSHHTDLAQSTFLMPEEIAAISDSILIIAFQFQLENTEGMEAFRKQLKILTNFLLFSVRTGVEKQHSQNLLIHFEAVAFNAAQAFINAGSESTLSDFMGKMRLEYSLLAPKVNPFDPQLSLAYTEALSGSRFSTRFHSPTQRMDHDTTIQLNGFLDTLISVFWDDLLQPDPCQLDCKKDQLQMLYEALRFSRAVLNQRPKVLDNEILVQVGVFVCDAGVLIFSFHQPINAEIDPRLPDLFERIKIIQAKVEKTSPRTSAFSFPVTQELGYVHSMFENLMELTCSNGQTVAEILPQTMQEQLVFLKSFLQEPKDLLNEPAGLQSLRDCALKAAYRVQFLIDRLVFGGISNSFSNLFDSILEDIKGIKTEAKKISFDYGKHIKVQTTIGTSSNIAPQRTPSTATPVVGFHNEATSIVNQLTTGSKRLRTVLVCGMGGLGKTTLAFQVYNDTRVTHHFRARAWCSVSQVLDKKKVLIELLNQIHPREYWQKTEDDLTEMLRRNLKRKRYLIFLDDVWNIEVWNTLKLSFPDDYSESRILLTSRHDNIAPPEMCDKTELVPLNFQDSLILLQMKAFGGAEGWPPTLVELGKQIAEKCKGLPLIIVIVAGLLAKMKQESWKDILDGLSSVDESRTEVTEITEQCITEITKQCMNTLELSYNYLPDYLKPCLLYFGGFPENEEVSVRRLIRLWIAEGFIRKTDSKRKEDVANEYMTDLIERRLVMVAEHRSIGGAKTCRIHDLIHDFCLRRAKQESFCHVVRGDDQLLDFKEPCYLQRLFIHSELRDFRELKLYCPRARSLLFFPPGLGTWGSDSFNIIILKFKLLKVLDIWRLGSISRLPCEIGLQLKYLSIRSSIGGNIASCIGNLFNLETLILQYADFFTMSFSPSISNLKRLKHLQIGSAGVHLEGMGKSPCLSELETFSWAIITNDSQMKEVVRKFPNIRKLKLRMDLISFGLKIIPGQLESLAIWGNYIMYFRWDCGLSTNLRKVKLMWVKLSRREFSIIGELPNLQVLKLEQVSFPDYTLEMEEGKFLQLRFFKLTGRSVFKWKASDELPNLQRLVLRFCGNLKEIPTFLESIPTLEEIGVFNCSREVERSVERIRNEQMELGNQLIKIHIQSHH